MRREAVCAERPEERVAASGVDVGSAPEQPLRRRIGPEPGDEVLQEMAHPAGPDALPPLDASDRRRVADQDRQAQVGPERLRDRAHDRPAFAPLAHGQRRSAGDRPRVVVLDHQDLRLPGEHGAQLARARAGSRAAPVGFCPRGVAMNASTPARSARARSPGRGPESSTPTGSATRPSAATRSKTATYPGSSTAIRSPGRRWACSTRSIPSSAPLVTARAPRGSPSASSWRAASARSAGRLAASPYRPERRGRRPSARWSGGRSARSGLPSERSRRCGGAGASGRTESGGRGLMRVPFLNGVPVAVEPLSTWERVRL